MTIFSNRPLAPPHARKRHSDGHTFLHRELTYDIAQLIALTANYKNYTTKIKHGPHHTTIYVYDHPNQHLKATIRIEGYIKTT